jgi:transcriptional antiterminator NusG
MERIEDVSSRPYFEWFLVNVAFKKESQIKNEIERRMKILGKQDELRRVIVPVKLYRGHNKNGVSIERDHKVYSGFLLVQMHWSVDMYVLMRAVNGVSDFIHIADEKILPISELEAMNVLLNMQEIDEAQGFKFDVGETVAIGDGALKGMKGIINEISDDGKRVKVEIFVMGRSLEMKIFSTSISKWVI